LHKSWNHEGGISTPLIVYWPDGIHSRNELRTDPGHLIDIVPTILEITGAKMPETLEGLAVPALPGKSMLSEFRKNGKLKHEYLWWNHEGNRAFRVGNWKIAADHQSPWELYDLSTDRSETKNLADKYPAKVKELEKEWISHANDFGELSKQDMQGKNQKIK
jgi:arylsulfatase